MKKFLPLAIVLVLMLSLAACGSSSKESYNLGNADRARVFYNTYTQYVENYGEAKEVDGALHGAAVVRLYDFTGDGEPEMLIAYSSEKDGEIDKLMVCGFDMGFAEIYNEDITSKSAKDAEGNCLWIYTDSSGLGYIITGEDLSQNRSYLTYQQAGADGKSLYAFAEAFDTDGADLSGTYEKIELTGNTDSKAIFEKNQWVIDALESQKN